MVDQVKQFMFQLQTDYHLFHSFIHSFIYFICNSVANGLPSALDQPGSDWSVYLSHWNTIQHNHIMEVNTLRNGDGGQYDGDSQYDADSLIVSMMMIVNMMIMLS